MKRILHLTSSIRGAESYSIRLGRAIVEKVQQKYPGSTAEELDLVSADIPQVDAALLQVFFTPADQLTAADRDFIRFSEDAVRQLMAADIVVIGAPLYNFTIHTALKSWIDHITRPGMTFAYGENGPVGMVTGKKVYVAMSSGGVYSDGPMKAHDFVAPYLKTVLGFLGMTDLTVFRAEGVKIPGIMEHALEKGIGSIHID